MPAMSSESGSPSPSPSPASQSPSSSPLRHPFVWAAAAGLVVLAAAFAPVVWQVLRGGTATAGTTDLPPPWQIERGEQGELRAFGLRLPGSTLADAAARWGDDLQVAVIESRTQGAALEAYVERWQGGGVSGRLVLATDAEPAAVQRWRGQAVKRETIDGNAQRWELAPDDRREALRSAIAGLSFLPANRLDPATLDARFGAPAERVQTPDGVSHALYPDRGLAIAWDPALGKAVLQLVPRADVERRLRQPLLAALSASAASPASGPTR